MGTVGFLVLVSAMYIIIAPNIAVNRVTVGKLKLCGAAISYLKDFIKRHLSFILNIFTEYLLVCISRLNFLLA